MLNQGYGWASEQNLTFIFDALFSVQWEMAIQRTVKNHSKAPASFYTAISKSDACYHGTLNAGIAR
jgi:hypothetical protein